MAHRFRNSLVQLGTLSGAAVISAFAGLLTLALNTRGLGTGDFGVLSLVLANTALFGSIATFETWQPVVRFGVRAPRMLGYTLSAAVFLDVMAALVAAMTAFFVVGAFGDWTGIPSDQLWLAQLHALSLLAGVAGTPKGYFRLAERFDILARNQVMLAISLAVVSMVLWWIEAELPTYVVLFGLVAATYNMTLMIRMLLALRKDGVVLMLPFASARGRRVLRLMFGTATGTSLYSTLSSTRRNFSLLLVGGLLGQTEAGILAAAASLSAAVSKVANLILQILFKTVLQAAKQHEPKLWRRKVMRATGISALAATALALACIPLGSFVPQIIGADFAASVRVFQWLFAAECAAIAVLHLNPVIQEKVGPRPLIGIAAAGLGLHMAATFLLAPVWGTVGAGMASLLANLVIGAMMVTTTNALLRQAIAERGN